MSDRCPNCGSNLSYDPGLWLWRCGGCRRIYAYEEITAERVRHRERKNRTQQATSRDRAWHSPRDNRIDSTARGVDLRTIGGAGRATSGSGLKGFFGWIGGLAFLFGLVLVIASTVSMIWPQGVVQVVPKQLEILRVLPTSMDVASAEIAVFEMVNEERGKEKLPPLTWDESIASYSRKHSLDMAEKRDLYHNTVELAARQLGENAALSPRLAGGFILLPYPIGLAFYRTDSDLLAETVQGWMRSSGHRQNILNSNYKFTGVGIAVAGDGVNYYLTQNFR